MRTSAREDVTQNGLDLSYVSGVRASNSFERHRKES